MRSNLFQSCFTASLQNLNKVIDITGKWIQKGMNVFISGLNGVTTKLVLFTPRNVVKTLALSLTYVLFITRL